MEYEVRSYGGHDPYPAPCNYSWPVGTTFNCYYGVFKIEGKYTFSYEFQAFYNGYIFKGTEYTPQLAEKEAWYTYELRRDKLCKHDHKDPENCEKRGYKNGCGFCIHCGLFVMHVFDIETTCINCGERTNWSRDVKNNFWCESCCEEMPEELQTDVQKHMHMEANHRRGVEKIKEKVARLLNVQAD